MLLITTALVLMQRNNTEANNIIEILDYLDTFPIFCSSTIAVIVLSDLTTLDFSVHLLNGHAKVGDFVVFETSMNP